MPMNPVIAIISLGKAQQIGYHPDVILVGRLINDGMGSHVARRVAKLMAQRNLQTTQSRILVLGLAFKENCPDLRNTRVVDTLAELRSYNAKEARDEYGVELVAQPRGGTYDAVTLAVSQREFIALGSAGSARSASPARSCSM